MPQLFGDERQEGMEQAQCIAHDEVHHRKNVGFAIRVLAEECRLAGLDVPVAVFAPEKSVERGGGVGESVRLESYGNFIDCLAKPQQYPAVIAGQ